MEVKVMKHSSLVTALAVCAVLAACGGGGGGGGGGTPTQPNPPANPNVVTVNLNEFAFSPRQVTVEPGQTVRWVLQGSDPTHTVTALDGRFNSGTTFGSTGATFQQTFSAADNNQTFEYRCASHADCCDMKGSVRVGANAPQPDPGY
jgi:plastocyanin